VEHYFSEHPRVASHPAHVRLTLPDLELDLLTDRGVFAYGQIDRGTQVLLRTAPVPIGGDLLDLGCGYGAVAVTLAKRCPSCRIWAIDINERALALCAENARSTGADNIQAVQPAEVPENVRFAGVYSNPPIRVGKESLHDLLSKWLDRLQTDGHGYVVIQRALGSDSLAAWLGRRGHLVERLRSRGGYRVLDIRSRAGADHHGSRDT
jgi:16S rRNA (guanine1207-N2)-methyltransferase